MYQGDTDKAHEEAQLVGWMIHYFYYLDYLEPPPTGQAYDRIVSASDSRDGSQELQNQSPASPRRQLGSSLQPGPSRQPGPSHQPGPRQPGPPHQPTPLTSRPPPLTSRPPPLTSRPAPLTSRPPGLPINQRGFNIELN